MVVEVIEADSLAVLAQNATIQALSLIVSDLPKSLLGSLATMPALNSVHLASRHPYIVSIGGDDIQALCAKPLKSLSLYDMALDSAACAQLAAAQTASLRLQFCTAFGSEDFVALSQNRSITSLFMMTEGITPGNNYEAVLSMVTSGLPQLESLTIDVGSETPVDAKAAIEAAWAASGRLLVNLDVTSRYVSANPS